MNSIPRLRISRLLLFCLVACSGLFLTFAGLPTSSAHAQATIHAQAKIVDGSAAAILSHRLPTTRLLPLAGRPGVSVIQDCKSVPDNINHLTLTDAQYAEYAMPFPEWFAGGRNNPMWIKAVKGNQVRDCVVKDTDTVNAPSASSGTHLPLPKSVTGTYYGELWSGWQTDSQVANTWLLMQGDFELPEVLSNYISGSGEWAGIGGYRSCLLVQAGVSQWWIAMHIPLDRNFMWVENYGNDPSCSSNHDGTGRKVKEDDSGFSPQDFDHMYVLISGNSMYVEDQTVNPMRSFTLTYGPNGNASQMECIMERWNGQYLPEYTNVITYNNCMGYDQYNGGHWYYIGQVASFLDRPFVMTSDGTSSGTICTSSTHPNSTGGFTISALDRCTNTTTVTSNIDANIYPSGDFGS